MVSVETVSKKQIINEPMRLRSCGVCDFKGETPDKMCPQCEEPILFEPQTVGFMGFITALLGAILIFAMTFLLLIAHESFADSSDQKFASRMPSNTPAGGEMIVYSILSMVLFFGITTLIVGVFQWHQKRRNLKLINLLIKSAMVMFFLCQIIMILSSEL